jgi:uncharacterized repeat protein (TIGR02543 family)
MAIPQVWAWYVPGNLSGSMRDNITANNMNADNKITFFAVPAGTYKLQLTNGSSWSGNSCVKTVSGCTKGTDGTYATITISAAKNVTVEIEDPSNWKVKVTATDPCTYIKYGWGGGDWNWSQGMNPYGDGKYACVGQYSGGKDFTYQVSTDEEHYNDGKSNVTVDDGGVSLTPTDNCIFIYDVTESRENPKLTIKRCSQVGPTNYVYFDNTESNWSGTYVYFMIGRPVNISNPYLATYRMTAVGNTKLYRYIHTSGTWTDADYYAVGERASSAYGSGNNGWTVVPANFQHWSAPYTSIYNMENTHYYMISKTSGDNNTPITIAEKGTALSSLNNLTVRYKYHLNGSDMSSGATPAKISMGTYSFSNCSTTVANSAQEINQNTSGTYTKSVSNAAYRGMVTLTMSNLQDGYIFLGWYEGDTQKSSAASYTFYPKDNTTITAKFAYKWNINGGADKSGDEMGDWDRYNGMGYTGTSNTYSVTIPLAASTTYDFKVVNRVDDVEGNNVWWGKTTANATFTRSMLTSAVNLTTTGGAGYNMRITTDVAGDYTFTYIHDGTDANKRILVKYPCATAGKQLFKFETKSSGLGTGNVCSSSGKDYVMSTENALSALAGGSLTARAENSNNRLQYAGNAFKFNNGDRGVLRIDLDCPLQTGDVIRYINSSSDASYNVYVRKTSTTTSTNQLTLAGNNPTVAEVVVTSAFNGESTIYIVRGGADGALISHVEIIRPYVVTLDASTNGGQVNGNNTEVHYMLASESLVLPHADKTNYRFKGWYTTYNGSTSPSNPYTPTANATLYAQFEDCPSSDATVYKFQLKTTLSNEAAFGGVTGDYETDVTNYLSTLIGGTLLTHQYGSNLTVVSKSKFQFGSNNEYLKVDLDCALETGDKFITTIGNDELCVTTSSTRDNTYKLYTGSSTTADIPAAFVGAKTLYIWRDGTDPQISYFEVYRPAKYTITYAKGSADGASGDLFTGTKIHEVDFTLSSADDAFTRTGYTYDSWSTSADGSTDDYELGGTYSTDDDITLYPHWVADVTCAAPTSLTNGTTRYDTQAVSWTAGDSETAWEVYVSESSDTPAADATPTASPTSASFTFTGLSASTTYYWWVRAVCDESDKSDWVAGTSFTTSASVVITGAINTSGYGTVSPSSITVTSGSTVSLSSNVLTCDGKTITATYADATTAWSYAFSSWSGVTDGGTVSSATTATAVFTRTGKSYTITLDKQVASNTPTGSVSATYGSAMPSIATLPSHANYTFGGFYTNVAGGGTCYYNGSGVSQQNSDFTSTSTLYAKFTQSVTLNDNHGGDNNGSATATYAGTVSSISAPEYSGHTVDGYYAESGCSNLVMTAAGVLQTSVTDGSSVVWTDGSNKWKHAAASKLYAHWKCDAPTVTCTDNVVTMTVPSGATVYYTTDGSTTPTSGSTAYDPSNKPVIAANTTIKAIAIQDGCTSSSVTTQSCTYTAYSTSYNIEQYVLDNNISSTKFNALKTALTGAAISYDLSSGCSLDTLNDAPSDKGVYKVRRNEPYLGLKVKSSGKYIQINLKAGKTLKVKFGYIAATVDVTIDDVAQTGISSTSTGRVYELASSGSNRVVKLATSTDGAVVIKQIMIGEDEAIESVTLPAKITLGATTNGSISVDNTIVDVGSDVAITVTPSSGYDLDELTVTHDTIDNPEVSVTNNEFTMPNGNVTINATFVASCTDPGLAFAADSKTTTLCDAAPTNALTNTHSVAVTYTSSDETVATVASDGTLTIKKAGTTTITASSLEQTVSAVTYCADNASYTLTVNASTAAGLAYGTSTVKKDVGDDDFTNTLTNGNSLTGITYTSSNTDVATVNSTTGLVDVKAAGTTIITASSAQQKVSSTCYAAGSATYTLTVYPVYTVTYDAMGGTCATSSANTSLDKVTLPSASHDDYTTYTWVEEDGTEAGDAGDNYEPSGNVTLYAKWQGSCAGSGSGISVRFTSSNKNDAGNAFADMSTSSNTTQMVGSGTAKLIAINSAGLYATTNKDGYRSDSRMEMVFYFSSTSTLDVYVGVNSTGRSYGLYSFEPANDDHDELSEIVTADYATCSIVTSNVSVAGAEFANTGAGTPSLSSGITSFTKIGGAKISYTSLSGFYVFKADGTSDAYVYGFDINGGSGACYTVTYDGNSATSGYTNDPVQYAKDADPVVLDCGYEKTGYVFIGWAEGTTHRDAGTVDYQPDDVITDISENKTLYAIWKTIKYFVTEGNWNTSGNWSPSGVPAITDPVVIQANVTVDTDEAKALSVDIESGNTLTIGAGKALIIEKTLTKAGGATAAADVIINSTRAAGVGALIIGGETGTNKATVNFATKAKNDGGWVNQFIGSPFSDNEPYVDYAIQLYKFVPRANGDRGWWSTVHEGDEMEEFWGYNVLYNDASELDVTWTGTLNASESKTISGLYYNGSSETDNMFANSWTAPIHVGAIEDADLPNASKTLYMFNAGTPAQEEGQNGSNAANNNSDPGTYISIPIHSAPYAGIGVIPSMQAFYVEAQAAGASITLDYNKVVYTPALTSVGIVPNRAPKHNAEVVEPEVIKLHVQSETGWGANTYVLSREDFSEGYEDGWDGAYIEGESATPKLYTPSIDGNMFINCLPEIEGTVVGFRKGSSDNNYIFSFDYDRDEVWYLNDQKAQKSTQIMNGQTYAFVSEAGDNAARFVISATPINKIATGCESVGAEAAKVRKLIINDKVYIIRGGQVFDVLGKTIKK